MWDELDQPKMNSVRDAYRGCKTWKPVFLLFRLVESTLDQAAWPVRVSHVSVTVYRGFQIVDWNRPVHLISICNLKSSI